MMKAILFSFWVGTCLVATAAGSPPAANGNFHGRHVLLIGIDGVRPDALQVAKAPVIQGLAREGAASMKAVAGGELGTPTQQPTISGPGWTTLLTGTYTNKHGITGNSTQPELYHVEAAPHLAKRLKEAVPRARVASIVSWPWIDTYLVAAQPEWIDYRAVSTAHGNENTDEDLTRLTTAYLKSNDPDFVFVHFEAVDHAGHGSGFSPENPTYLAAIEAVDAMVGRVLEALKSRPASAAEDWLVIVTTDHGGIDHKHGGQSPEERTIPMIVSGRGSSGRGIVDETPGQHVIPATIFGFLGVPVKPEWGWEPGTFGLKD